MFALGIDYLNGWSMAASDGNDKLRPEWPPHPDRVFMSLVAAWAATGKDEKEKEALHWLERQPLPSIVAGECNPRSEVTHYVPVNETPAPKDRMLLIPEKRGRQARRFATVVLKNPVMYMVWRNSDPSEYLSVLQDLSAKVVNVGHSASLVNVWVEDNDSLPHDTWEPVARATDDTVNMRVFYPGRLDDLVASYDRGQRPEPRLWKNYRPVLDRPQDVPESVFRRNMLTFSAEGSGLDLTATSKLVEQMRNLVLSKCPTPIPEWISGHTEDGAPSKNGHISFIPLPFVGRPYANGRIMGFALVIPVDVSQEERSRYLSFLLKGNSDNPLQLYDGRWNEATLTLVDHRDSNVPLSLQANTWTSGPKGCKEWRTVTPVTLDRYYRGDASARLLQEENNVKDNCERIGLPRPIAVYLSQHSLVSGVPMSRDFPRLKRRSDNGEWQHTHAAITFDEPVRGPVIIGSGRYRGYGLCRPVYSKKGDEVDE